MRKTTAIISLLAALAFTGAACAAGTAPRSRPNPRRPPKSRSRARGRRRPSQRSRAPTSPPSSRRRAGRRAPLRRRRPSGRPTRSTCGPASPSIPAAASSTARCTRTATRRLHRHDAAGVTVETPDLGRLRPARAAPRRRRHAHGGLQPRPPARVQRLPRLLAGRARATRRASNYLRGARRAEHTKSELQERAALAIALHDDARVAGLLKNFAARRRT